MFLFLGYFIAALCLTALVSYLLGSISFSIIFTKIINRHEDIRTMGSGNAGLTNVLRSVGIKAGILTLICDFAKGVVSVWAGITFFHILCVQNGMPPYVMKYGAFIAGLSCVLGHIYPVYFQFRGGKGILASAAMLVLLDWRCFCVAIAVFAAILAISRIVSLSSMAASASFPIANFLFTYFIEYRTGNSAYGAVPLSYVWITTAFSVFISVLLIWKHRENIKRLLNGTEHKFTVKHSS